MAAGATAVVRSGLAAPAATVELEVVTEQGVSPTAAQEWLRVLKDFELEGFRIRSARGNEQPEIVSKDGGRRLLVIGVITAGGTLVVPGGKFSTADGRRFGAWLTKLKSGDGGNASGKPVPFGLTADQIVTLYEALAAPVSFSTKGRPSAEVVRRIRASVKVEIAVAAAANQAFGDDEGVLDELEGVAAGTALAAILRPLGLVLVPEVKDGPVKLAVIRSSASGSVWPVGWPPEKNPTELVPMLLKFLDVEINETPLLDALDAIQQRLKVPFLLDHNGLARHRIDPATKSVTVRKGKTFYSKILDQIVGQAKLKWELRIDEAGQPLVWISTRLP